MKTAEKTALIAEASLLYGRVNLGNLAKISTQEAMNRCKNYNSKNKIARARKVFKNVLKQFTKERLVALAKKVYIDKAEEKSKSEIIQLILTAYTRSIVRDITMKEMIEKFEKEKVGKQK